LVLLDFKKGSKLICRVKSKKIGKDQFPLAKLVNENYGNRWRKSRDWEKVDDSENDTDFEHDESLDNRDLKFFFCSPSSESQRVGKDEIVRMKKEEGGEKLIDELVKNSTTFSSKTRFAQEKYIKKKRKKHLPELTVRRCSILEICNFYFQIYPEVTKDLRQILIWEVVFVEVESW